MSEKRCKLCNKPYEHHYALFGRGCLENLYELLGFSMPRIYGIKNYICAIKLPGRTINSFLVKRKNML